MELLLWIFELLGTIAFAISGALTGIQKQMDLFGVCILGLTTAVGGGIVRDLILGLTPPRTFQSPFCAFVALGVSLVVFAFFYWRHREVSLGAFDWLLRMMDSVGLGVFTVNGIAVAQQSGVSQASTLLVFVGVVTGVGGGLIRDLFAGNRPYIFVRHVYACAALAGAICYVVLYPVLGQMVATLAGTSIIVILRFLSGYYRWNLPKCPPLEGV